MQIQHGDVLLKPIDKLPDGVTPGQGGHIVVMEGEATGHHHVITDETTKVWFLKGEMYLEVAAPTTITHDEHKPLAIPEGIYQIGRVREYDYFQEMEKNVCD